PPPRLSPQRPSPAPPRPQQTLVQPQYRPVSAPVSPVRSPGAGTGLHRRPAYPQSGPVTPRRPRRSRGRIIGGSIAAVLIVAIAATVTVLVMQRRTDAPGGNAGQSHSAVTSSSASAPAQVHDGVATGSIVVDDHAYGFSFEIP